jgi:hypothetical protein
MFIFGASEPRDAVYALLAIARDASPYAQQEGEGDPAYLISSVMEHFLEEKPFRVDYSRSYPDVCRDFIEFAIRQKNKWDPVQALDILCRPWALKSSGLSPWLKNPAQSSSRQPSREAQHIDSPRESPPVNKPYRERELTLRRPRRYKKKFIQEPPDETGMVTRKWINLQKKATNHGEQGPTWIDTRTQNQYIDDIQKTGPLDSGKDDVWTVHPPGWDKVQEYFSKEPRHQPKEMSLPTWVALASRSPFNLYHHPGQFYSIIFHLLKSRLTVWLLRCACYKDGEGQRRFVSREPSGWSPKLQRSANQPRRPRYTQVQEASHVCALQPLHQGI